MVDLLPDEGRDFIAKCRRHQLSVIPLVTPSTTEERIRHVASTADSFVYCVRSEPKPAARVLWICVVMLSILRHTNSDYGVNLAS